jgi:hypothetical protein
MGGGAEALLSAVLTTAERRRMSEDDEERGKEKTALPKGETAGGVSSWYWERRRTVDGWSWRDE